MEVSWGEENPHRLYNWSIRTHSSSPVLMLASGIRYLHFDSSGRSVGPFPVVRSQIPLRRRDSPRRAEPSDQGAQTLTRRFRDPRAFGPSQSGRLPPGGLVRFIPSASEWKMYAPPTYHKTTTHMCVKQPVSIFYGNAFDAKPRMAMAVQCDGGAEKCLSSFHNRTYVPKRTFRMAEEPTFDLR